MNHLPWCVYAVDWVEVCDVTVKWLAIWLIITFEQSIETSSKILSTIAIIPSYLTVVDNLATSLQRAAQHKNIFQWKYSTLYQTFVLLGCFSDNGVTWTYMNYTWSWEQVT